MGNAHKWTPCPILSDGREANGRYDAVPIGGDRDSPEYYWCVYPQKQYLVPSVSTFSRPVSGAGSFYQVSNASLATTYNTNGSLADSTGSRSSGYNAANPEPEVSLNTSWNAKTIVRNGLPVYGYYRFQWYVNYADWKKETYPAWLGVAPILIFLGNSSKQFVQPYTYACNLNPALQQGIVGSARFTPAACDATQWQCVIQGGINQNGTPSPIEVVRNGEQIPVTFPSFTVAGNGVQNVRNQQSNTSVNTATVSPVNGADPNGAKQYFKASWSWNAWVAWQPAAPKWESFYWTSDQGKEFSYTQKYRFTGDFWVPTQGSINEGTAFKWVTDTSECGVTKSSAPVTVLRSANG